MRLKPLVVLFMLPAAGATAAPLWSPIRPAGDVPRAEAPFATPVQFNDGGYYERVPEAPLREFIDQDGNRIFLNEYGEVVSVVPPAAAEPRGWSQRRFGEGVVILEGPVEDGRYGGYQDAPVEPGYNDYRQYPPAPNGVQSAPLPAPQYGSPQNPSPQNPPMDGPRPYTPPTTAGLPPSSEPAAANSPGTAEVAALQVFLDRAGASPGVIDGQMGSNVRKAMEAYTEITGRTVDPQNVDAVMSELAASGGLPIRQYTITAEDVAGPFITNVPTDYAEKALLPALSYTSAAEKLAEKFHMDESYLRTINPNADFSAPGTVIKIVDTGANVTSKVARVVADKARKQVRAYGESGQLVAAYPATIGSQGTPSPSGTHKVERIALDPVYTYNPKINFTQGDNTEILTIPPGPNGPVGSVWIALSKPTYGIHGTPEPSKIGKTESNGCIRLTNWDAQELAKLVSPGVTVEFLDAPGENDLLVSDVLRDETLTPTVEPTTGSQPAATNQAAIEAPQAQAPAAVEESQADVEEDDSADMPISGSGIRRIR